MSDTLSASLVWSMKGRPAIMRGGLEVMVMRGSIHIPSPAANTRDFMVASGRRGNPSGRYFLLGPRNRLLMVFIIYREKDQALCQLMPHEKNGMPVLLIEVMKMQYSYIFS